METKYKQWRSDFIDDNGEPKCITITLYYSNEFPKVVVQLYAGYAVHEEWHIRSEITNKRLRLVYPTTSIEIEQAIRQFPELTALIKASQPKIDDNSNFETVISEFGFKSGDASNVNATTNNS